MIEYKAVQLTYKANNERSVLVKVVHDSEHRGISIVVSDVVIILYLMKTTTAFTRNILFGHFCMLLHTAHVYFLALGLLFVRTSCIRKTLSWDQSDVLGPF